MSRKKKKSLTRIYCYYIQSGLKWPKNYKKITINFNLPQNYMNITVYCVQSKQLHKLCVRNNNTYKMFGFFMFMS